jgi:hypothetical protein
MNRRFKFWNFISLTDWVSRVPREASLLESLWLRAQIPGEQESETLNKFPPLYPVGLCLTKQHSPVKPPRRGLRDSLSTRSMNSRFKLLSKEISPLRIGTGWLRFPDEAASLAEILEKGARQWNL